MAVFPCPDCSLPRRDAATQGRLVKDKAVVLLFLQGGPPQIEFFDPKMSAPVEFRSITGEVQTKIPGVTFGGTFPKLAAMTDKIAVVRSFASGNADHQKYLSVAGANNSFDAPMGGIYSRIVGSVNSRSGLPTNCIVLPEAVSPGLKLGANFETNSLKSLLGSGTLGPSFAPFDPSGGGDLKKNLELHLDKDRFGDRKSLLDQLDGFKRQLDTTRALDSVDVFQQQAYDVILRGIAQAFDVTREDPKTIGKYDTSGIFPQEDLQKFYDMRRTTNLLGRQMLLARRLVEAGCGFVTVTDAGWDFHANNNSPKNMAGMTPKGLQVDWRGRRVHRRFARARPFRQGAARRHRRNGPHTADQQERRPRPLRQPDAAAPRRRRTEDGPDHRPVGQQRFQSDDRKVHAAAPVLDRDERALRHG